MIPQRRALLGLSAAKRQVNRLGRFRLWCNMRSPLLCSGCSHLTPANGKAVCPAHIIAQRGVSCYSLKDFFAIGLLLAKTLHTCYNKKYRSLRLRGRRHINDKRHY